MKSWNPGTSAPSPHNEPCFHRQEATGSAVNLFSGVTATGNRLDPEYATKDGIVGIVVQSPELKSTIWDLVNGVWIIAPKNWDLLVLRTERRHLLKSQPLKCRTEVLNWVFCLVCDMRTEQHTDFTLCISVSDSYWGINTHIDTHLISLTVETRE